MQALEVVEKELKDFQDLISKDERLAEFIANPILKKGLKADALASVAEKTNMTSLSSNLLRTCFYFRVSFSQILTVHLYRDVG